MAEGRDDLQKVLNQKDLAKKSEGSVAQEGDREVAEDSVQKQILDGIRNFYTKPPGGDDEVAEGSERTTLGKRMHDLQEMLEKKNVELEEAKCSKEIADQEVRAYEILLTINQVLVQAIETKISVTESEISKISSAIGALKNEHGLSRAYFINRMVGLNNQIRKLQDIVKHSEKDESGAKPSSGEIGEGDKQILQIGKALKDLEAKIADIISQTKKEQDECQEGEHIQKKVKSEIDAFEKREIILKQLHEGIQLIANK